MTDSLQNLPSDSTPGGVDDVSNAEERAESEVSVTINDAAVLSLIREEEPPVVIARRAGTSLPQLFAWFDAYHNGGRARL